MRTDCIQCIAIRYRVLAVTHRAFGKSLDEVFNMLALKSPELGWELYYDIHNKVRLLSMSKNDQRYTIMKEQL